MRAVVWIALIAWAAGCSTQPLRKAMPGDEPYDAERMEAEAGDAKEAEDAKPVRRIVLPKGQSESKGLVLNLRIESPTVEAGGNVRATVFVRNTNASPMPVTYASEKRFDLFVFRDEKAETPVHVWSEHQLFAQNFSEEFVGAGTTTTRMLAIPTTRDRVAIEAGAGDLGTPLGPGEYWVWATHEGTPYLATGPVKITVQE